MNKKETKKDKIGLALGMGAARGLIHIGALKAIEEYKIKIDYISGTSMGALIGGAYASGMSVNQIEEIALNTNWKDLAKFLIPTFNFSSNLYSDFLEKQLREWFGNKTFSDLKIPFVCVATDIKTGKMIVLDKGELVKSIRASISLPIIFSPVPYGRFKLVDGGLVNPTPVDVIKNKVDKVIAVSIKKLTTLEQKEKIKKYEKEINSKSNFINEKLQSVIKQRFSFLGKESDEDELSFLNTIYNVLVVVQMQINDLRFQLAKPDLLIQPDVSKFKSFEFSKAKEIIEVGYKFAKEELKKSNFV